MRERITKGWSFINALIANIELGVEPTIELKSKRIGYHTLFALLDLK